MRHREPHPPEEAARPALADVPLGLGVRLCGRDPDGIEPQLAREPLQLGGRHLLILHAKAPQTRPAAKRPSAVGGPVEIPEPPGWEVPQGPATRYPSGSLEAGPDTR